MAEHADAADELTDSARTDEDIEVKAPRTRWRKILSGAPLVIAASLVIVATVVGLVGWLGYRTYQTREAQAQRDLYVQVARQAAINLTTISYTDADSDIQRILDSATGSFHDDFQSRSKPFVDVVKQVQSKSVGTVAEAGLESEAGDQARVLVAVSVMTSSPAAPQQDPRRWRMRVSVQKTADGVKVSNVEFVP